MVELAPKKRTSGSGSEKDRSFFHGELFPGDAEWLEKQSLSNLSRSEYEFIVAKIARILRTGRRARKNAGSTGRGYSLRVQGKFQGSGHQLDLINGAGITSHSKEMSIKRASCAYCGGPIDTPQTLLPDPFTPLLGVKFGRNWYHRELCLAKRFKIG